MSEFDGIALLCLCATMAGFVDAVVGGGGLIQLPALFLFLPQADALPAAVPLATNKFASICGTSQAAFQYARRLPLNWSSLLPAAGAAFAGSFLGARAVTLLQPSQLKPIVLVLLGAVAIYTFVRKDFGGRHAPAFTARHERILGVFVGAGIGFYDGFFGPGTGSFLIFIFIGLFGFDFLTASASAKVINFATNLSAVGYFAATGHVLWHYAVPMGVCNVLGSLAGTRLAMLKGNRFVRAFFLVVVSVMIARFGWDVLFP